MTKLYIEDFTESHYRELIRLAKKNYEFVDYNSRRIDNKHILWRHDLDTSIHRALKIAQIEKEEGVLSTFFVMVSSPFYNIAEKEVLDKFSQILSMGHKAGLHFDQKFFDFKNQEDFEKKIEVKKVFLEDIFQKPLEAISFHNPDFNGLIDISKDSYSGMVNAYGPKIYNEYKYVSDSNGHWRFDRLFDVLADAKYQKLQILTHPEWWVETPMSPRIRILRAVDGRRNNCINSYDEFHKSSGRLNV